MSSRLRAAIRLAGFAALTLPLMPLQQVFLWTSKDLARTFPHHFHRLLCRVLGFRVECQGQIPTGGACLLVANHVSWIDIIILSAVMPLSFIAKREVAQWPFFGKLAKLQRSVFIDRDRRHKTADSRDELQGRLAGGDVLVLFPEGTSGDGSSVLPFKSSFFAAAGSGVAVVPVSIAYTHGWNMPLTRRNRPLYAWYGDMDLVPHLWEALASGPLAVKIVFHEPLAGAAARSRKDLAAEAEHLVRRGLVAALHAPRVLE